MTRKDYELIAAAIAEGRDGDYLIDRTLDDLVARLIERFAQADPRFDRDRFITASGSYYG